MTRTAQERERGGWAALGHVPLAGLVGLTLLTLLWGPIASPATSGQIGAEVENEPAADPSVAAPAPSPQLAVSPPIPPWDHSPACLEDGSDDAEVVGQRPGEVPRGAEDQADILSLCATYGQTLQLLVTVEGPLTLPTPTTPGTVLSLPVDTDSDEFFEFEVRLTSAGGGVSAAVLDRSSIATEPLCDGVPAWSERELAVTGVPATCLRAPLHLEVGAANLSYYDPDRFVAVIDQAPDRQAPDGARGPTLRVPQGLVPDPPAAATPEEALDRGSAANDQDYLGPCDALPQPPTRAADDLAVCSRWVRTTDAGQLHLLGDVAAAGHYVLLAEGPTGWQVVDPEVQGDELPADLRGDEQVVSAAG